MRERVLELVMEHDELADLDAASRRLAIRDLVVSEIGADALHVVPEVADAIDAYGPLSEFMRDPNVTDVVVNGPGEVWIERCGRMELTDVTFTSEVELRSFAERLLGGAGGRVDASWPIGDARLADGSRLHVVLPPVAAGGPLVSIRRFPKAPLDLGDLVAHGMLTPDDASFLCTAVEKRLTIAISGATGTGKTTLMNALLGHVGGSERVVLIEETRELRPRCAHVVSLVARPPNVEGIGAVDLTALVRAALRMRPDRIVVGEVRGAEALAAIGAMVTGHEGSMVTLHARSGGEAIQRMVSLALQASSGATELSLERQVRNAFDLVVHLERDGEKRALRTITEVH